MPDDDKKIDPNSPEIKTLIDNAINAAIEPLKKKNDELVNEKKGILEKFKDFDEEEIARFHDFQKKMENDEDAQLISQGKINEVIDKRTERMRESYQEKLAEAQNTITDWETRYNTTQSALHNTLIDNSVRAAALEAGVAPTAIDDIIIRAHREFSYENDKIVSKDSATGEVKIGSDGKTPFGPKDFMNELKTKAPHFWPVSTGAGFTGGFGSSEQAAEAAKAALHTGGFDAYRLARKKEKR